MRRLASTFLAVAALLVVGVPASAQDPATGVSFGEVSFSFGPELGASANATQVAGQRIDRRPTPFPPDAKHLTFTLYGTGRIGGRTPRVGWSGATVSAYRISDLAGYDALTQQLDALRTLVADRPDLADYTAVSDDGGDPLPHLPSDAEAAQALKARATYIETPALSGIAYLVGYRQDVSPFAAGDFWYTFQALSTDGEWYVSGDFVVEAEGFPDRIDARAARAAARRWTAYLDESIQTLDAASPDTFSPPLTTIDALIDSIAFAEPVSG